MKLKADGFKQPKMQVETRWSSVYEMLGRLIELKEFCLMTQDEPGFENLKKSAKSWANFEDLHQILQLPAELTLKLQAEDLLVIDFVYHWFSMMFRLKTKTASSLLASSLVKCLEEREKQMFANNVIITGWYLDKNLFLMHEMKNDIQKKN